MTSDLNWDVEKAFLTDMAVTACGGHERVAAVLWDGIANAGRGSRGVRDQKILMARLCGELVAAHEDLGALLWAIKNRTSTRRVVQNYLRYAPGAVSTIYKQLDEMSSVVELLSLPKLREDGDRESVSHSIEELTPALAFAAQNYAALDGRLVRGYNKMKHGFVLIQRVDQIAPNRPLHNDWQNQVHIALGWDRLGIDYLSIDRSEGTMSDTIGAIKMCYLCWKELAGLTILLGDRGVLYAAS